MPFHIDYRPKDFDEVIGNKTTIRSLQSMLDSGDPPHAYLFHGVSGCGKTTLARILANKLDCSLQDYMEINSSNNRGIDTAREIAKSMNYAPLAGKTKFFLLDEVHQTTKDFQNALLKPLEDTPSHAYFVLCTTDPQKLLNTVRNRCQTFEVRQLNDKQMVKLIHRVVAGEGTKYHSDIVSRIIDRADGCPRSALIMLEQIIGLPPDKQKKAIKAFQTQEEKTFELCKSLLNGDGWEMIARLLKGIEEEPERIRRSVLGYMNSVMLNSKKGNTRAAIVMHNFKDAFYTNARSDLTLACFKSLR